jgi:hypothetical protein
MPPWPCIVRYVLSWFSSRLLSFIGDVSGETSHMNDVLPITQVVHW